MPRLESIFAKPVNDIRGVAAVLSNLVRLWNRLAVLFNGRIGIGNGAAADNLDCVFASVATPNPIAPFTVSHNLLRVPSGYWIVKKDATCDIFEVAPAATTTQITLQATATGVNIVVLIY